MWSFFLYLLLTLHLQSVDNLPSLAYSHWNTDQSYFTVHDLTSDDPKTITRPEDYSGRYTGRVLRVDDRPLDYIMPSPTGEALIMRETPVGDTYNYTLLTEHTNLVIADNMIHRWVAWSDDGQVAYFATDEGVMQYTIETHTASLLLADVIQWSQCTQGMGCLFVVGERDLSERLMIHLDLDTGDIQPLITLTNDPYSIQVISSENQIAVVHQREERIFTLFEDRELVTEFVLEHTDEWIVIHDWIVGMLSHDEAVLLVHIETGKRLWFESYTSYYDIQHGFIGLSGNRIAFSARTDSAPDGGIYVITLDDGFIYETVAFSQPGIHYDQAWSPDGNWLAYLEGETLFITRWDGDMQQSIETPYPITCVAWLPEYFPDTLICDKNWGSG